MRRRVVLAGIASGTTVGVAGCLGTGTDGMDDAPTLYEVDAEVTMFESDYPLTSTADVVSHATEETPARVEIGLTNTGDDALRKSLGATPPFSDHSAERIDGDATAYLAPDSRRQFGIDHVDEDVGADENPPAPIDGCWVVEGVGHNLIATNPRLEPGEEITETYSVFADVDNDGCLPAGTYRFEEPTGDAGTDSPWVIDLIVKDSNGS